MRAFRCVTATLLTLALPVQPALAQTPVQLTSTPQHVYTNSVATIRGVALTSNNKPLDGAHVRLRNARNGRINGVKTTDHAGLFEFANVEPGSYIVELVTSKDEVLAASDLLNPNGGDLLSTIVKLPYDITGGALFFGHTSASALAITAAAAAAGVLAIVTTGNDVSPRR